ncbi:phosphatidate cytidylyltransferase [Thecamonas trahens ATCC 50062]|uniref:Phosphatidate cytidylyltransferase n=1 Tax=Thecamonas trahens ATCC 50062 TaxID=461836 RepID=A0A0L0D539_THETB|nr:phosphatidate cytidylyltransferase [Thecamonas trahens ATCC 50062]KNC47482.1 phosphatidate cytidylyltransferase [Thecamonas trahens ATCC 50062]|eukprot:XP_013759418.1 phosphatidate cytidylyltransferase [Thecamonas trahens ATCC 50062]
MGMSGASQGGVMAEAVVEATGVAGAAGVAAVQEIAIVVHDSQSVIMAAVVMVAIFAAIGYMGAVKKKALVDTLKAIGITKERAKRVFKELLRKVFHFSGAVMPTVYYVGLRNSLMDKPLGCCIMVTVTSLYLIGDVLRLSWPAFNHYMLVDLGWNKIMRKEEYHNFTGIGWYFAGNTLATLFFKPTVAMIAMCGLVLGDFFAALVGKAVGRTKLLGSKSLEGSTGCFAVCFACSIALLVSMLPALTFGQAALLAFAGALAATLAELFSINVNDNITLPLASGVAISLTALWLGWYPLLTSDYEGKPAVTWALLGLDPPAIASFR